MGDTEEFSEAFAGTSAISPREVESGKLAVVRYKGKREKPQWVDLEPGRCAAHNQKIANRLLV